jgi:hypothetical protein
VGFLVYTAEGGAAGSSKSESRLFTSRPVSKWPDLRGFVLTAVGIRLDSLDLDSPGGDPNGDGNWTDYNWTATIFVIGGNADELIRLVQGANLRHENSLIATLEAVNAALMRGDSSNAAKHLQIFQRKVDAHVTSFDPPLAVTLISKAQVLIDALLN